MIHSIAIILHPVRVRLLVACPVQQKSQRTVQQRSQRSVQQKSQRAVQQKSQRTHSSGVKNARFKRIVLNGLKTVKNVSTFWSMKKTVRFFQKSHFFYCNFIIFMHFLT